MKLQRCAFDAFYMIQCGVTSAFFSDKHTRLQQKEQSEGNHSISLHCILFVDAISVHSMTFYLCSTFQNDEELIKEIVERKKKLIAKWYKLQRVIEARRNRPKRRKTFQSIGDGWRECGEKHSISLSKMAKKHRSFSVPFQSITHTQRHKDDDQIEFNIPMDFLLCVTFARRMRYCYVFVANKSSALNKWNHVFSCDYCSSIKCQNQKWFHVTLFFFFLVLSFIG